MSFYTPLEVVMTTEHGMPNGNCVPRPNYGDEIILIQTDINWK